MPEVKLKVLEFANKVSGKKMGSKSAITVDDPRYTILEPVVSNEMAEVALAMEFRKPLSAEELAEKMRGAGFDAVGYRRFMFGTMAIHWGRK